jgi:hypothetical protein
VVEVHLIGVTVLVIGAVQAFLACTYHPLESVEPVLVSEPTAPALQPEEATAVAQ